MSRQVRKRLAQTGQSLTKLHVLGAAGNVTGSLNLFEFFEGDKVTRVLLEVGMHQENDSVNKENRLPKGMSGADIDAVIISHEHIDHCGWLPALVKQGYKGPVYTQEASADMMDFMLTDSGYLQEAAAERINRYNLRKAQASRDKQRSQMQRGQGQRNQTQRSVQSSGSERNRSQRRPRQLHEMRVPKRVEPLYTEADAKACMPQVKGLKYGLWYTLKEGIRFKFTQACHILGAAVVSLEFGKGGKKRTFVFTGNIGRPGTPFLKPIEPLYQADYIMSESTYGNKRHEQRDRLAFLEGILKGALERASIKRGKHGYGAIIIPAFAVGRVQAVLYDLRQLMDEGRLPVVPVFVDSPMANKATAVHRKHPELFNDEARKLVEVGRDPFSTPKQVEVKDAAQSAMLDRELKAPAIIIGSSGMAAGGRVLQHLKTRLPGSNNTIVFVGFQGTGTLGKTLSDPEHKPEMVRIFGEQVPVNAEIKFMSDYSGHADYEEILAWLKNFQRKPKQAFLVHGEPDALSGLKGQIEQRLGWNVTIPQHRQSFVLD
jgi:metallo-beta-lactamase family protein